MRLRDRSEKNWNNHRFFPVACGWIPGRDWFWRLTRWIFDLLTFVMSVFSVEPSKFHSGAFSCLNGRLGLLKAAGAWDFCPIGSSIIPVDETLTSIMTAVVVTMFWEWPHQHGDAGTIRNEVIRFNSVAGHSDSACCYALFLASSGRNGSDLAWSAIFVPPPQRSPKHYNNGNSRT